VQKGLILRDLTLIYTYKISTTSGAIKCQFW